MIDGLADRRAGLRSATVAGLTSRQFWHQHARLASRPQTAVDDFVSQNIRFPAFGGDPEANKVIQHTVLVVIQRCRQRPDRLFPSRAICTNRSGPRKGASNGSCRSPTAARRRTDRTCWRGHPGACPARYRCREARRATICFTSYTSN